MVKSKSINKLSFVFIITMILLILFALPALAGSSGTPRKVSGLKTTVAGASQINLRWKKVAGAGYYKVYRSSNKNGPYYFIGKISGTSFSNKQLKPYTVYWYKVRAFNRQGAGRYSTAVNARTRAVIPGIPKNLKAVALNYQQVKLTWDAVPGAEFYYLQWTNEYEKHFYDLGTTRSTYFYADVSFSTKYSFKIMAANRGAHGKWSSTVALVTPDFPPDDVNGLTATTAGIDKIFLSWKLAERATSYLVYRSEDSGRSFRQIKVTTATEYMDTGLKPLTEYTYKVQGKNAGGNGYESREVYESTFAPPPQKVTGLALETVDYSQINLEWDYIPSAYIYHIYRAYSPEGPYERVGETRQTWFHDQGLTGGTQYWYQVKGATSGGEGEPSAACSSVTLSGIPGVPQFFSGRQVDDNIKLSWIWPAQAVRFGIYRAGNENGPFVKIDEVRDSQYIDYSAEKRHTYWYKVIGIGPVGEGEFTEPVSVYRRPPIPYAPHVKVDFFYWRDMRTQITFSVAPGADYYRIYRALSKQGPWELVGTQNDFYRSFMDKGLLGNSTYWYRVIGVNGEGEGDPSEPVSVDTTIRVRNESESYFFAINNGYKYVIENEEFAAGLEKAKQILDSMITPDMTDFEKELAIHDYIILNTDYDYNNEFPYSDHYFWGSLLYGKVTCGGYADVTYVLMTLAGIECGITGGHGHGWNWVKIDCEYYYLDNTWDDPGLSHFPISYGNFNTTTEECIANHHEFGGEHPDAHSTRFTMVREMLELYRNGYDWRIHAEGNRENDWVYFVPFSDNKLYKMRFGGADLQQLSPLTVDSVEVSGDWVYYTGIESPQETYWYGDLYRVRKDGTENTFICSDAASDICVDGDWIFYTLKDDGGRICKIKTDGTGRKTFGNTFTNSLAIYNGVLYYTDRYLYRMNEDGTGKAQLTDGYVQYLWIEGDWIYYWTYTDEKYKIRPDGTEKTLLES